MDFQSRFSRNAYFTDTSVCDVADDVYITLKSGFLTCLFIYLAIETAGLERALHELDFDFTFH